MRRLPFIALGAVVLAVVVVFSLTVGLPGLGGGEAGASRPIARVVFVASPHERALRERAVALRALTGPIDVLADRAQRGPFELRAPVVLRDGVLLRDVVVRAEPDSRVIVAATIPEAELAKAAPQGLTLRYDPTDEGEGLALVGSIGAFGLTRDITVRVVPRDGAIVAEAPAPIGTQEVFRTDRFAFDMLEAAKRPKAVRVVLEGSLVP